jgi:hypothetical protein
MGRGDGLFVFVLRKMRRGLMRGAGRRSRKIALIALRCEVEVQGDTEIQVSMLLVLIQDDKPEI